MIVFILMNNYFLFFRLPFTPLMIVAMETSNKIKEANENSEEISTGRRMSKLYFSCLLFQVRDDI